MLGDLAILGNLGHDIASWLQQHPYFAPLMVLAVLVLLRLMGWLQPLLPIIKPSIDSLTKSGDLLAAFPSGIAQRRLRVLLDDASAKCKAMETSELILRRWFGSAIWSPQAFDKMLQIAVCYPVAFLLLFWVFTGEGQLGSVSLLPQGFAPHLRAIGFLLLLSIIVGWFAALRVVVRWNGWRQGLAGVLLYASAIILAITVTVVARAGGAGAGAVALFVAFAFAVAFGLAIAGNVAFGFASTAAITFALAIGSGFVGSDASIVAVGIAFGVIIIGNFIPAGPGAITVSGAVVLALALTGASTGALAGIVLFGLLHVLAIGLLNDRVGRKRSVGLPIHLTLWSLYLGISATVGVRLAGTQTTLGANSIVFVILVFLGLLPFWNAVLDFISVGVTRLFLRRYALTGRGWWWMILVDIGLALVLTALLLWGAITGLRWLQWLGWGIDAKVFAERFQRDPTGADVNWLMWMALTNVLPTLLHIGLTCAGLIAGWLFRDEPLSRELVLRMKASPASLLLTEDGTPEPAGVSASQCQRPTLAEPLLPAQAHKLVNWIYIDFWLAAAFPWCVALACWPLWQRGMRAGIAWLL